MNEKEIYLKIEEWLNNKYEVVIASVVETWGSSPRPVGSIMAVNDKNDIIGSVSGGCVESFVFAKALEVFKNNQVQTLDFGVSNSQAWEVGLTCGGKIKVFLEKFSYSNISDIRRINKTFTLGKSLKVATRLKDGKKEVLEESKNIENRILKNNFDIVSKLNNSGLQNLSDELWYIKFFKSNIKIVIIGAVHITEPLIKIANTLGYEIHLIDPRDNFNDKKFDNVIVYKDWPDEALKKVSLNENSAIVTLTHDPKLDDPAIEYALNTSVFYLGCLGSNKTHNSRLSRLRKKKFSELSLNRIYGPVGIDISAKTPTEIALSIISQIVEVKNNINA